ncbi:MAG: hypothetical protein C0451_09665 [Comamonadaceae bacterium]|nr:hypothetical protein [Comamonadaceae bacterium]
MGDDPASRARTVVPTSLWQNPAFAYVALEVYLSDQAEQMIATGLACALIGQLQAVMTGLATDCAA